MPTERKTAEQRCSEAPRRTSAYASCLPPLLCTGHLQPPQAKNLKPAILLGNQAQQNLTNTCQRCWHKINIRIINMPQIIQIPPCHYLPNTKSTDNVDTQQNSVFSLHDYRTAKAYGNSHKCFQTFHT